MSHQLASLSAVGTPHGNPPCTARISVPCSASASAIVIVISRRSAESVVSNSITFDNLLVRHELHERPWNLSVCAFGVPVPVGAPYVNEIQNEPRSRALIACTWRVILVGTIHIATER